VHQLQMHNFDEWSGAAQAIKDFLNNHPDETAQMMWLCIICQEMPILINLMQLYGGCSYLAPGMCDDRRQ